MTEEKKENKPFIDEFKGKPIIRITLVEDPSPETSWHWLTFGRSKAKAIVKYIEDIKKFAEGE